MSPSTAKQVSRQIENALKKIKLLREKITSLQGDCPHPKECISENYRKNDGNWCESDDCYWVDRECKNCGTHWHFDSHEPGYRSILR